MWGEDSLSLGGGSATIASGNPLGIPEEHGGVSLLDGTLSSLVSEPLTCPTSPVWGRKQKSLGLDGLLGSSHTAFPAYKQGQQRETVDFMKPLLAFQAKH